MSEWAVTKCGQLYHAGESNGANRRPGSQSDSDTAGGTDTAGWTCPAHGPHNAADRTCPQCKADYYARFANQGAGAGGVGHRCTRCAVRTGTVSADGLCIQCCVLATQNAMQRHYASPAAQLGIKQAQQQVQHASLWGTICPYGCTLSTPLIDLCTVCGVNAMTNYAMVGSSTRTQYMTRIGTGGGGTGSVALGTIIGPVGTCVRPDVPTGEIITGEIYAWRAWKVKGGYLHSCCVDHHIWIPGEPMEGEIGNAHNGLGVHAFKTRKGATEYALGNNDWVAIGRVKLWGDVVEHKEGYRAQYAKVHEIVDVTHAGAYLFPNPARPDILTDLRKRYGVETPQPA